jgi:hypothetical protein
MNRRSFVKLSSLATAALLLPATLFTAGCDYAKSLLNTVISAVQAILKVAEPTAPWAVSLSNALTALVNAEAQWSAGGAVAIVIDALNTIENVLAVIPQTAVFSPLIAVLVTGIDAVLAVLVPTVATAVVKPKVTLAKNPYKGAVPLRKRRFYQTHSEAFKSQWNDLAGSLGLAKAKI